MEFVLKQNIQAEIYDKKVSLEFVSRNDFHFVMIIVAGDIFKICFVSTEKSLQMFFTACTNFLGGRKGDEEETISSLHSMHHNMKVNRGQNL